MRRLESSQGDCLNRLSPFALLPLFWCLFLTNLAFCLTILLFTISGSRRRHRLSTRRWCPRSTLTRSTLVRLALSERLRHFLLLLRSLSIIASAFVLLFLGVLVTGRLSLLLFAVLSLCWYRLLLFVRTRFLTLLRFRSESAPTEEYRSIRDAYYYQCVQMLQSHYMT